MELNAEKNTQKAASLAFIWSHFLKAPFYGMYILLVFILAKDLGASQLQIASLIALKPVVSLFSPYWSLLIYKRPDRIRVSIIAASLIAHTPFFFFPFISNPWWIIASGALFLMMKRAIIPAWMEMLKQHLPEGKREKTFSLGITLSYLGGALLPILFGFWMDQNPNAWRLLFPLTSLLSLLGILTLFLIPSKSLKDPETKSTTSISLTLPWKRSFDLLQKRPDFLRYQIGFMLAGGGLMLIQPALPHFFLEELGLTYTALTIAMATCKGLGFATTSRFWAQSMKRLGIYRLSALVFALTSLFAFTLLCGKLGLVWIYIAYVLYGVMQAGSELSWHLCGPLFAKDEDSSVYSATNVVTVGLRGLFAPFCGAMICSIFSPTAAIVSGGLFCLAACGYLARVHERYALN